jgi:hypothetical protein
MASTSLIVRMGLDAKSFIAGLDQQAKGIQKFFKAFQGLAIVGGVSTAFGLVRKLLSAADDIEDRAEALTTSTDFLQKFQSTVASVGVRAEKATIFLEKLREKMGEASEASSTAAKTFKTLGVSITNQDGSVRKLEEVFFDLQKSISQIPDASVRADIALSLFGKGASKIVGLLSKQADEFKTSFDDAAAGSARAIENLAKKSDQLETVFLRLKAIAINTFGGILDSVNTTVFAIGILKTFAGSILKGRLGVLAGQDVLDSLRKEFKAQVDKKSSTEAILKITQKIDEDEKKITQEKKAQIALDERLLSIEKARQSVVSARLRLSGSKSDRASLTLEELASGQGILNRNLLREHRIAQQVLQLEGFAEQSRAAGFRELALTQINRASELRKGLKSITSDERFPFRALEEAVQESNGALNELVRKASEEGLIIQPRNGQ